MASFSHHVAKYAEELARAHGTNMLSSSECFRLQQLVRDRKKKKLFFFNGEEGWKLRRLVKAHPVRLYPKQFCALCGTNAGNPQKLRPRPTSRCGTCSVHLCTVPNKYESGLSCFKHWNQNDCLNARTFYSIFARSSNRRSTASTDGDSEPRQSTPPRRPPQTPPRTSPPSPPPSPRRTRSRTRRRVSISPESSSESRPKQRRRTGSLGMNRFRHQQEQEERQ